MLRREHAKAFSSHTGAIVGGFVAVASFLLLPITAEAAPPARIDPAKAAAKSNEVYLAKIVPFLKKHCLDCHGPDAQEGDIGFHQYKNAAAVAADDKTWQKALEMLESHAMPPDDQVQPSQAEREAVAQWIEKTIYHVDCETGPNPGRVTIRRLNRAEYNNTVRDLLGVDFQPADDFPSDDVGSGFDNIGDVLSLPPLLMEKYLIAAEKIASTVVISDPAKLVKAQHPAELETEGSAKRQDDLYAIISKGGVSGKFQLPRSGEYILRATASATRAGDEPARMELQLGNHKKTFDVNARRDEPKAYEFKAHLPQGEHRLSATFLNDFYDEKATDSRRRDRNLYVTSLEVAGPLTILPEDYPESHRKLIVAHPSKGASVQEAARRNLRPLVNRAFRRKASEQEVNRFAELVEQAVKDGDTFEQGMQVGVTGVLVSPHFLFRVERDFKHTGSPQQIRELGGYELASRMSYFLWSSMPDDELFLVASTGKLSSDAAIDQQIKRMLKDPKADALVQNFASQWLNLRLLDGVTPDTKLFGDFNDALKADMRKETEMFFAAVMREDRSVLDFLNADYTFVNERLAKLYGLDGVEGDEFRRFELGDRKRAGVLTQASILTLTSNPGRTSPVKRGKWILDNLLGAPPPDPPPDIPELEAVQKAMPEASLRKQLEAHRENAVCASCHKTMDALGFALENYDPIGRWRDRDGKQPIDASGVLPGGEKFVGPTELVEVLGNRRQDFARCLTEKMLIYALGRELTKHDRCTVDEVVAALDKNDYRFSTLVAGILKSDPFTKRGIEGAQP